MILLDNKNILFRFFIYISILLIVLFISVELLYTETIKIKSSVINLAHNLEQRGEEIRKEDLAASFQKVAVESITSKVKKAIIEKNIKNVIVAGGVAANNGLRTEMEKLTNELNVKLSIPPMKYCTDNGTMIAAAGYYAMKDGRIADLTLNSKSQDTLI